MKKIDLKIYVFVLMGMLLVCPASAQYSTNFVVTGISDTNLRGNIDLAITGLLTAFNNAQKNGGQPRISGIDITPEVERNILKMWENCPFRCADTKVVENCTRTSDGQYQVRNIPLIMEPTEEGQLSWKKYQEGVFVFDKTGMVTDFHLALSPDLYIKVMRSEDVVNDYIQRQLILEYVERFRNAYNLKDMDFLEQVYSDDALIITGKVIRTVKSDINRLNSSGSKIVYSRQNKREYLTRLARIFKANKRINVLFDDIKVVKHPAKANFYGVTLKQGYESDSYRDEGYLFLLWDFTNQDAPQIHVRTWQPDKIDLNTSLPEEEIFDINDFDL